MEWLAANWGTVAVGTVVAAVIALNVINVTKKKKQGMSTCGCGCADCPMKNKCH